MLRMRWVRYAWLVVLCAGCGFWLRHVLAQNATLRLQNQSLVQSLARINAEYQEQDKSLVKQRDLIRHHQKMVDQSQKSYQQIRDQLIRNIPDEMPHPASDGLLAVRERVRAQLHE